MLVILAESHDEYNDYEDDDDLTLLLLRLVLLRLLLLLLLRVLLLLRPLLFQCSQPCLAQGTEEGVVRECKPHTIVKHTLNS